MSVDPRTPVIVGAGQFLHRAEGIDDALEPVELMAAAAQAAAADGGLGSLPRRVDSVRVVNSLSWRYRNLGWVLAERLKNRHGRR